MDYHLNGGEIHLSYSPEFREYSISYKKRYGGGEQLINYCPWCSKKLPKSLRDGFFDTLEEMGIEADIMDLDNIPTEFKTDEWWKKRKL
jgi:hypothetical protein